MSQRHQYTDFKSGFIAIAGSPNAGKSTLLNRILGTKLSITSKKPQTTRNRILGILHRPQAQLIFVDTPGVHAPRGMLNTRIVEIALQALSDVDIILVVLDAVKPDPAAEKILIEKLKELKRPVILAINKIDLIQKSLLLTRIDQWQKIHPFGAIIPISARHGTQVKELICALEDDLPLGPPFFPEDSITDLPEKFFVAEIIREKVFRTTGQEIPYASAVTIESFTQHKKPARVDIHATIHVERSSQKGILIGKGGAKIKEIGEDARKAIEGMLGVKLFLKLFVAVQKNWRKDSKALRRFGY